jgi:UDP-N-acetylglucosamine 2-epimerase (non-hydrolysing)
MVDPSSGRGARIPMTSETILHVVGARPNFPKLAPVYRAGCAHGIRQRVVHTGQHYDASLSGDFFESLEIPAPDVSLGVGSATHAVQTARIMEGLERVFAEERPGWIVVYGDVNSTMAAAIVASKLGLRVAHVEAGLRSNDRTMPEEINRIVTDRLSDLLLVPSRDAIATLRAEGEPDEEIVFVGNVMIDTLMQMLPRADGTGILQRLELRRPHVAVTLHRPSNVDDPDRLHTIVAALDEIADTYDVVFPVHPRTRERLREWGVTPRRAQLVEPLAYLEMLELMRNCRFVITDSGGIQEETTVLGVPCLTVRPNTERPITISEGTNQLVPDPADLVAKVSELGLRARPRRMPEGWDGHAGERVMTALAERLPMEIAAD